MLCATAQGELLDWSHALHLSELSLAPASEGTVEIVRGKPIGIGITIDRIEDLSHRRHGELGHKSPRGRAASYARQPNRVRT